MKILLITDNHSPQGGGAEKYFFSLKEKLENHPDIQVFSTGFSSNVSPLWRLFINPIKYWQLRKSIKTINPDVIHLHTVKCYMPTILHAVKGYPVVQTTHDYALICPASWNIHNDLTPCPTGFSVSCFWKHRNHFSFPVYLIFLIIFFRLRRLTKKVVKHYLPPSPLLANYLTQNGFGPATYIPPPQSPVNPPTASLASNHFLFLGQLGKHKGIYCLLEEFAIACKTNPDLKLTMAGRGREENNLRKKIKELNLANNIALQNWSTEPAKLYQDATVLIVPSLWQESFGLVTAEAMSHARAVIGSNRGATAWLVDHEKTGLLFDPAKKGDLAQCILKLASNFDLAKQYGNNAYEKFKTFPDNEMILREIIEIYKNKKGA